MNKHLKILTSIGLSVTVLAACSSGSESEEPTSVEPSQEIRLGTTPGPYSELFLEEVAPILEDQGYTIDVYEFQDVVTTNTAMDNGEIDLNVDQHRAFMENFNEEAGTELAAITPIPTLPTAIYPANKESLEEVEEGDLVGVPQDPSNFARAMAILDDIGWIELDESVEPMSVDENDILENYVGIDINAMDSASIPQAIPDMEYFILPGSFVYDVGIDTSSALAEENIIDDLFLHVVVHQSQAEEQWVEDVAGIYESEEFKERVAQISQDPNQPNWQIPE